MDTKETKLINIEIYSEIEAQANIIFKKLGISMSEAIDIFLLNVVKEKGLPFFSKFDNLDFDEKIYLTPPNMEF